MDEPIRIEIAARARAPGAPGGAPEHGRRKRNYDTLLSMLSPIGLLLLWEVLAWVGALDVRFAPPPSSIAVTFAKLVADGTLVESVGVSLLRVLAGFVAGTVPGILLGLSMGLFPIVNKLASPLVATLYPIPKMAIMPVLMLFLGLGEITKITTLAMGVFFLAAVNTATGVLTIPNIYMDVARNLRAPRWKVYISIALPGALPMIFAGMRLGLGVALILIVAAEMIAADSGIGYMLWTGYSTFDLKQMYVSLILFGGLGFMLNVLMEALERRFVPWKY